MIHFIIHLMMGEQLALAVCDACPARATRELLALLASRRRATGTPRRLRVEVLGGDALGDELSNRSDACT